MSSNALIAFKSNKQDIVLIWGIHQDVADTAGGPGRPSPYSGVEVLNRAAIVFICACWEAYVEDAAIEAFDHLCNAPTADAITTKVKALVGESLATASDKSTIWNLADKGWQDVLIAHRQSVMKKWVESFNTPKSAQVDWLFENLLGLRNLTSKWRWKKMTKETAARKLDEFISMRGDIAHRLKSSDNVKKNAGTRFLNHVERLAKATDAALFDHLRKQLGRRPW